MHLEDKSIYSSATHGGWVCNAQEVKSKGPKAVFNFLA